MSLWWYWRERESNNGEVVQWVDDILHNCLFIVRAWGSGIYDIPELVGDTILQIEGNISFVVLLLMLLLCLLKLFCNFGTLNESILTHTLQWFHSRLWFHMLCIFVCMFIHCEWWYAVCVCSTVAECYRPPKSHDHTSPPNWVFKFYILSILVYYMGMAELQMFTP